MGARPQPGRASAAESAGSRLAARIAQARLLVERAHTLVDAAHDCTMRSRAAVRASVAMLSAWTRQPMG
jgi:hypothetical protein